MNIPLELSEKISQVLQAIDYKKLECVTQATDWQLYTDDGMEPYNEDLLRQTAHETLYNCVTQLLMHNLDHHVVYTAGWYCCCDREHDRVLVGPDDGEDTYIYSVSVRFVIEDYEA